MNFFLNANRLHLHVLVMQTGCTIHASGVHEVWPELENQCNRFVSTTFFLHFPSKMQLWCMSPVNLHIVRVIGATALRISEMQIFCTILHVLVFQCS